MKALIEVEMGEKTCGECPISNGGCLCNLFDAKLEYCPPAYLRCPACLAKYGTGDQPKWSKEPPTDPGWYWWRRDEGFPSYAIEIKRDTHGPAEGELFARGFRGGDYGEWGPQILPPGEVKPDPRDAVVEAARSPCYCDYGLSYHFPGCPVGIALAALDAEGGEDEISRMVGR